MVLGHVTRVSKQHSWIHNSVTLYSSRTKVLNCFHTYEYFFRAQSHVIQIGMMASELLSTATEKQKDDMVVALRRHVWRDIELQRLILRCFEKPSFRKVRKHTTIVGISRKTASRV